MMPDEMMLRDFLELLISSSDEVFSCFRGLSGAREVHGSEKKQGYLYVPGVREDRRK